MSEEVSGFVRHRYSWHSPVLNRFIENLDRRYSKQNVKSLAKKRVYGSTRDISVPTGILSWMKAGHSEKENVPPADDPLASDQELISLNDILNQTKPSYTVITIIQDPSLMLLLLCNQELINCNADSESLNHHCLVTTISQLSYAAAFCNHAIKLLTFSLIHIALYGV